ncbi:hypothetical protein VP01_512g1 [Puccinia sorghi]|uniref:Retrovirus-related Pol polyprotein from transposon TNT 1-94-like beta-barrel domain-containing protein n=1 Tax=Puccinia sorghi TaxID=27349 RepID=A0A0L6ULT2_9BASI|nr:hypothetical protein VP01_512g1 [Puccinia sorghi]
MTSNLNLFFAIKFQEDGIVRTSSGAESLKIKGIGSIKLTNELGDIILHNVLFVPDIAVNLLSVHCLVLDGYQVHFEINSFFISKNDSVIIKGRYESNLPTIKFSNLSHNCFFTSSELLHKSLGHVSYRRIRQRLGIPLKDFSTCEACAVAKITKGSFHTRHSTASKPFEEIHLDIIPAHKSKKSPFELFKNRSLPLDYFRPIGIRVSYLYLPERSGSKLEEKGGLGTLVGYNDELRSYRILTDEGKVLDTNHIKFLDFPKDNEPEFEDDFVVELFDEDDRNPSEVVNGATEEEPQLESSSAESITSEEDSDEEDIADSLVPSTPPKRTLRDRTERIKPIKYSHLTGQTLCYLLSCR